MIPWRTLAEQKGDVAVLRTSPVGPKLFNAVGAALENGTRKILLDAADLMYLDSACLSELIRSFTRITRQGGHLKIFGLSARLRDLLAITKLLDVFEVFDDEEAALASFRS